VMKMKETQPANFEVEISWSVGIHLQKRRRVHIING